MPFAKLKICSKLFDNFLSYSSSDSKNFLFVVIFPVWSYLLRKKIINVFIKILQFGRHFGKTEVKNQSLNHGFSKYRHLLHRLKRFQIDGILVNLSKLDFKKKRLKKLWFFFIQTKFFNNYKFFRAISCLPSERASLMLSKYSSLNFFSHS